MGLFRIDEVDDVLSIGGIPSATEHISKLKEAGISTIVSVEPMQPRLAAICRDEGIRVVNLAVKWGGQVPEEKLKRFLSVAALAHARGKKIFLHCLQGKHRTGQMAMAYLNARYHTKEDQERFLREHRDRVFTIPIDQLVESNRAARKTRYQNVFERARKFPHIHPRLPRL